MNLDDLNKVALAMVAPLLIALPAFLTAIRRRPLFILYWIGLATLAAFGPYLYLLVRVVQLSPTLKFAHPSHDKIRQLLEEKPKLTPHLVLNKEAKAEEQAPCILDEVCIEEMAVDGICGIY